MTPRRSRLHLVPAPIGAELSDFAVGSLRALAAVRDVFVESEGRVLRELRARGVVGPDHRVFHLDDLDAAATAMDAGRDLALVPDSGLPGLCDPGWRIVRAAWARREPPEMVPVGMSSALDAALAMAGVDVQGFTFAGHYPETTRLDPPPGLGPVVVYVRAGAAAAFVAAVTERYPEAMEVRTFRGIRDRRGMRVDAWEPAEGQVPPEGLAAAEESLVAVVIRHWTWNRTASPVPRP